MSSVQARSKSALKNRPSTATSPGRKGSSKKGQARIPCPPQIVTGVDKLEVSCFANNEKCDVFDKFAFYKKKTQEGLFPSIAVNFNDNPASEEFFRWNLQRIGTKLYPYVLKCGDVTLLLATRGLNEKIPNVKIEIGSVSCQQDAFGIYGKVIMWLKCYGIDVQENIVSRIDLCADTIGESINGLGSSSRYRWVRRGRKFIIYYDGNHLESVQIGKGSIVLRVYDKIKELQGNEIKKQFFFDLWGFDDEQKKNPPPVTRTEFQLRRAALKEFQVSVDTVEEIEQRLDSLWNYCTTDWAKLTSRSVNLDRLSNNQHLVPPSKFWKRIQLAVFVMPLQSLGRVKKNLHKNLEALKDQARGCLLNVAAAFGHDPKDYFGIISTVQEVIADSFHEYMVDKQSDFEKKFKIRRNEIFVGF